MTAAALLAELHSLGVTLERVPGNRLRASAPRGALTREMAETIRAQKAELLSLLSAAPEADSERWPHEISGAGLRRVTAFSPCVLCGSNSWSIYGETVLCRGCAASPATPARLRYRAALLRCWALTAQAERADLPAARQVIDDVNRLIDEIGEPAATELRHRAAQAWWRARRTCPTCGGPTFHDPTERVT